MANAQQETVEAPVKNSKWALEESYLKKLEDGYDLGKRYDFKLAEQNVGGIMPVYEVSNGRNTPLSGKKYKPFQNLILSSQIVWKGARTNIMYYDGCETIFCNEQPKDKELLDQLKRQTKQRNFLHGSLKVMGDEKLLLFYMDICSWNTESPFRTRTANQIFTPVNADKIATEETAKLDLIEKALELAKSAPEWKMRIHGGWMGIFELDESDNQKTDKQFRAEYRKLAMEEPKRFIDSYGNNKIELQYYIDKALMSGLINTKMNANKAAWQSNDRVICDVSGLKTKDAIAEKLFEHSQTEEGEEFVIQLKSLFNNDK